MKSKFCSLLLMVLTLLCVSGCEPKAPVNYLDESQKDFDKRMEWWRDAGFGMFIHWGPYAVPAGVYHGDSINGIGEWIMNSAQIPISEYEDYARAFNPVQYNADEWVAMAKDAGMKYIIITSKHHDGFCLWDSEISKYDVMDFSPIKRDLLKELKEACDRHNIVLGFYYSIMDWHHPQAQGPHYPTYNNNQKVNPDFASYIEEYMKPQLKELVEKYDPDVLWFDGEWVPEYTHEQGQDVYQYVRSLKPEIIINNRVDKGRQGMQGMTKEDENFAGDFGTPEQEILEEASTLDWESCMTLNDTWGYKSWDHNWKSTQTLVHNLVDISAKGGNYLLNIGPMANGLVPDETIERLKEVGAWMKVNAEVVHNSRAVENYMEDEELYFVGSKKNGIYYAITTSWPGTAIQIKYLRPEKDSKIYMLGYSEPLEWNDLGPAGFEIIIPDDLQDEENRPCDFAWVFKMSASEVEVVGKPQIQVGDKTNPTKILFTDQATISLAADQGSDIYFTIDGSDPSKSTMPYLEPIEVEQSTTLRAVAVRDGAVNSQEVKLQLNKITSFKAIEFALPYSEKYSAQGPLTLGNGVVGGDDFFDMEWLGWEGENFEALIDMGEVKKVNRVSAGFMNNIHSWIFLPLRVQFSISTDGKNFRSIGEVLNDLPLRTDEKFRKDFELKYVGKFRYLKVEAQSIRTCPEWHQGAGEKAWLFVDEIIVE